MKNILVILADFYPYPSSNTNCIEPFLYGLRKNGYKVDVVTRRQTIGLPSSEIYNGINIVRIDDYKTMNTLTLKELMQNNCNRVLKLLNRFLSIISKAAFYAYYRGASGEERYGGWDIKKVKKVCHDLNKQNSYDCILSISHPFITHEIAMDLKNEFSNNVKWAVLEFDPYTYNEALYGKNLKKSRFERESYIFDKCDKLFLTPELIEFYNTTPLAKYKHKFIEFYLPNMNKINADKMKSLLKKDDKRVQCVYGGALLKSIRNPLFMIKFFYSLKDYAIVTMMSSSRVGFMKKELNETKDVIRFYSGQPKEIAQATMLDSDILVNIGNTVVFQTPGKIFEYMAMGKPIIHFSKIEKDPAVRYLINYPMLFIVKEYCCDYEKEIEECKKFINKYRGKTISFDEVIKSVPNLNSSVIVDSFVENINLLC